MNENNLYEVLEVKPEVTTDDIKSGFRKLAHVYHPDKNNNSKESQVNFQIIYNAYETLIDPGKRKEYDAYLRTSSVVNKRQNKKSTKKNISIDKTNENNSVEYFCTQFNYILWEIEDILRAIGGISSLQIEREREKLIRQWLLEILKFIDKWVLNPASFIDYFYEARGNPDKKSFEDIKEERSTAAYRPYTTIYSYFYDIRMRMNQFIEKIKIQEIVKTINGYQVTIADSIIEAQMLSYHYLGLINRSLRSEKISISKFIHSNKCYEEAVELIGYRINPDVTIEND